MVKFKSIFFGISFLIFSSLFLVPSNIAFGQTNPTCISLYGAQCPNSQLSITKKVQNPKTGEMVHTLTANDVLFGPENLVNFNIQVQNIGSANLNNIQIQDKIPDLIDFVSSSGNFDANNRTINWKIDNLSPNQSQFLTVQLKIKSADKIPSGSITCLTNFVQATQDNQVAQDTAGFCFQLNVLGAVTELPRTGPPITVFLLIGLLPLGLWLYKISIKEKITINRNQYLVQIRDFSKEC